MTTPHPPRPLSAAHRRLRITVRGVVQGVGFRPFVYRTACEESLRGWVLNEADAVRIEVEGNDGSLDRFLQALRQTHPPQARIDSLEVSEVATASDAPAPEGFEIRASSGQAERRPTLPADLAMCAECLQEISDPRQRRYRYPFTNCTNCGPRWSIIRQLPYDRPRTSMHSFAMCGDCQAEYGNPGDRRFHAQPIACPKCGPQLTLLDAAGRPLAERDLALRQAADAVGAGRILALQGLGGFQLIADATSELAVQRLRERKRRPDKPLAIMLGPLSEVRRRCRVSEAEAAALQSPAAPILLLARRRDADGVDDIAPAVAPGNPQLGVMLPSTPLHHLLLAHAARPLICTSGNLSEEPMAITARDAVTRLGSVADLLLTHDRPIVRPVDDSVAHVIAGRLQILRRARGYAPLPIRMHCELPVVLAVGGHLKNTVALSLGESVVMTPHVGDLETALSVQVHRQAIDDLIQFFGVRPQAVACDLHPDYASTRNAERLAQAWGVPLVPVQHHQAHVAACVAEHGLAGPVLGFSWDGTGYGTDRTVWGGEALLCDGAEYTRVAQLRTFPLPGGDRAARQPRRSALGVLYAIFGTQAADAAGAWFTTEELGMLIAACGRPRLFPRTSSLGRLFDAVAALCGLPAWVTFEGQAAMALEFAANPEVRDAYPLPVRAARGADPAVLDWEPMIRAVLADRAAGLPVAEIAARFHNALAAAAVQAARMAGCRQVVLTGGCFQNAFLTERVQASLRDAGFQVYVHSEVPPGDGGIALGQILIAAKKLNSKT
ncbi:MAG: carbamoyltransferase HypF [Candidatus Anammoximicrobium sp.]|nr:carbamoyltransferase HypF [Candidatus Anammoximicrobium sp.]